MVCQDASCDLCEFGYDETSYVFKGQWSSFLVAPEPGCAKKSELSFPFCSQLTLGTASCLKHCVFWVLEFASLWNANLLCALLAHVMLRACLWSSRCKPYALENTSKNAQVSWPYLSVTYTSCVLLPIMFVFECVVCVSKSEVRSYLHWPCWYDESSEGCLLCRRGCSRTN